MQVQSPSAIVIGFVTSAPADRLRGAKRAKQHIKHRLAPSIGAIRSVASLVQRLYFHGSRVGNRVPLRQLMIIADILRLELLSAIFICCRYCDMLEAEAMCL